MALGGLQRQLEEAVQRQTATIEEKIRAFTAEQYQLLEQFRERAHNEHRLLSKYEPQIDRSFDEWYIALCNNNCNFFIRD